MSFPTSNTTSTSVAVVVSPKRPISDDEEERKGSKRSRWKEEDSRDAAPPATSVELVVPALLSDAEKQQIRNFVLNDLWSDHATITTALEELADLTYSEGGDDEWREAKKRADYMVQLGVILSTLQVIKQNPLDEDILSNGCNLLSNLANKSQVASLLIVHFGMDLILKIMRDHPNSVEVQGDVLSLLGHVFFNKENKNFIDKHAEGLISGVLSAMKNFFNAANDGEQVQQWGCMALRNIARWGSAEVVKKIIAKKGDELVWQAKHKHAGNEVLQEDARAALRIFLDHEEAGLEEEEEAEDSENASTCSEYRDVKTFASDKDIDRMVPIVTIHIWQHDATIVQEALRGLSQLLSDKKSAERAEANAEVIYLAGGHLATMKVMDKHFASENVQTAGLQVLANIACDNTRASSAIVSIGGVDSAVSAMKQFDSNADLQAAGCALLGHLAAADNATASEIIDHADALKTIVGALGAFPDNAEVQEFGSTALKNLCDGASSEQKDKIIREGGLISLATAATRFSNEEFAHGCWEAIEMLKPPPPEETEYGPRTVLFKGGIV